MQDRQDLTALTPRYNDPIPEAGQVARAFSVLHDVCKEPPTFFDSMLNFLVCSSEPVSLGERRVVLWPPSSEGEVGAATGEEKKLDVGAKILVQCLECGCNPCYCNETCTTGSQWALHNLAFSATYKYSRETISKQTVAALREKAFSEVEDLLFCAAKKLPDLGAIFSGDSGVDPDFPMSQSKFYFMVLPGKYIVKVASDLWEWPLQYSAADLLRMTMRFKRHKLKEEDCNEIPENCEVLLYQDKNDVHEDMILQPFKISTWRRIDSEPIQFALAFLLGTHKRLGQKSLIYTLDNLVVVPMIVNMYLNMDYSEDEMMDELFASLLRPLRQA
jgi:hypothetical protein